MKDLPSVMGQGGSSAPSFDHDQYVSAFTRLLTRPGDQVEGWGGARLAVRRFADGLSLLDGDGALHCITGPAEVTIAGPPWRVVEADWHSHGEHVLTVIYTDLGSVWEVHRFKAGVPHSEDQPAFVLLRSDGSVETEEWWRAGQRHRNHGPALISYDENGVVTREAWFSDGEEAAPPLRERRPAGTAQDDSAGKSSQLAREQLTSAETIPDGDVEEDREPNIESEEWFERIAFLGEGPGASYTSDDSVGLEQWSWLDPETSLRGSRLRTSRPDGTPLRDEWFVEDEGIGKVRDRLEGPAITTFDQHGYAEREWFFMRGLNCGTRSLRRWSSGSIRWERWELDGELWRPDNPAVLHYRPDGSVESEHWYTSNDEVLHRDGGPAVRWYRTDGTVESEHWYEDQDLHRADGPARIWYREDGSIEKQSWYTKGQHQRSVRFRTDGSVEREEWYLREWSIREGELHRVDGPAVIRYRPDGSIENEEWWLDGELQRREAR